MARRYAIYMAPVEHLNGKLAPSSHVCHNQPDTSESDVSFYYGYRYGVRPDVSRYALRERARDLSEHPYTDDEQAQKALFTSCVDLSRVLLSNPTKRPEIEHDFHKQARYVRLYNYTIAMLVKNNGVSPW